MPERSDPYYVYVITSDEPVPMMRSFGIFVL